MRQRRASARQADESRKLILKDLLDDDIDNETTVDEVNNDTSFGDVVMHPDDDGVNDEQRDDMMISSPSSSTTTTFGSMRRICLNMLPNDDDGDACCSPQGSPLSPPLSTRKRKAISAPVVEPDDDDYRDDDDEEEEDDGEYDKDDDDDEEDTDRLYNDRMEQQKNYDSSLSPPVSKRQRVSSLQVVEPLNDIKQKIKDKFEVPLKVIHVSDEVGNGVVAQKRIPQGHFVCEYSGQLISNSEAKKREKLYAQARKGCFMFYFNHSSRVMCIDATEEHFCSAGGHGRLINHRIEPNSNLFPKKIVVDGKPHIVYIAARDIEEGEEISFDYGDRRRETIEAFPWLLQ